MEMNNYDQEESNGKKTLWIIGGIILVVMIVALVYGATQKSLKNADTAADSSNETIQLDKPTTGAVKPTVTTGTGSDTAVLGDSDMIELPVSITKMDVVNLKTIPQQVQARISYGLSGDCAVVDTPNMSISGKVFTVTMTSHAPKNAPCTRNIVPGEIVVELPVDGLAVGKYTVKAGTISKTVSIVAESSLVPIGEK